MNAYTLEVRGLVLDDSGDEHDARASAIVAARIFGVGVDVVRDFSCLFTALPNGSVEWHNVEMEVG